MVIFLHNLRILHLHLHFHIGLQWTVLKNSSSVLVYIILGNTGVTHYFMNEV